MNGCWMLDFLGGIACRCHLEVHLVFRSRSNNNNMPTPLRREPPPTPMLGLVPLPSLSGGFVGLVYPNHAVIDPSSGILSSFPLSPGWISRGQAWFYFSFLCVTFFPWVVFAFG